MSEKDTNPKDALGIKKAPVSTLPAGVKYGIGLAMLEGARKYGRHNYRVVGVRASVYYDAYNRHVDAWWEGEDIDPDSGLHHLDKAMACLIVLRDSMLKSNWADDRPPKNKIDFEELNQQAAGLIEKYPDSKKPYTEIGQYPAIPKWISPDKVQYCPDCEKKITEAKDGDSIPICEKCRDIVWSVCKKIDRTKPVPGGY